MKEQWLSGSGMDEHDTMPSLGRKPRAWLVALSCCWVNLFVYAVFRSAGVLYMALVRKFGCSPAQAAWPITLASGVASIACLPAGFLSHYFSVRSLVSAGILLTACSISACFFADSLASVVLCLGLAQGERTGAAPLTDAGYCRRGHRLRRRTAACPHQ